ncbi:MAG TPA: hypothetical protein VFW52_00645 [Candidatus Saccharimonadales bacterium]|nr:hypothetical protein [Candidatus Saccharimonadales bacterium]
MFYFAHAGEAHTGADESSLSAPDIRQPAVPQTATGTAYAKDTGTNTGHMLAIAGLAVGFLILATVAAILLLKRVRYAKTS